MFFFFQDNSKYRKKYRRLIKFKELVSRPVSKKFVEGEETKGGKFLENGRFHPLRHFELHSPLDFTSQPALMHGTCGRVNLFTCIHRSTQPTLWSVIRVHFTVNCRVSSSTRAQRTPAFLRIPHLPFCYYLVLQMLLSALH